MSSLPTAPPIPTLLEVAARSEAGPTRYHNEDRALGSRALGLCLVADGMGGSCSGEAAPILLLEVLYELRDLWSRSRTCVGGDWGDHPFVTALQLANLAILHATEQDRRLRGMGTTVVAALAVAGGVLVAHVGDSRCYRLRDGMLEALTLDHSLRNEARRADPPLSAQQLAELPASVLTRGLGFQPLLRVEVRFEPLRPRDVFLLCSDGITATLEEAHIAATLLRCEQSLELAARQLITEACARAARDNVSVVLGRWG